MSIEFLDKVFRRMEDNNYRQKYSQLPVGFIKAFFYQEASIRSQEQGDIKESKHLLRAAKQELRYDRQAQSLMDQETHAGEN